MPVAGADTGSRLSNPYRVFYAASNREFFLVELMRRRGSRPWSWLKDMIARKPPKLVAIALANKLARFAWKLMVSGERYRPASAVSMPTPT